MSRFTAPRVVAVVVTYNRLALLQRLLERLAQTEGLAEVLVVDNDSTDGTTAWLADRAAAGEPAATQTPQTTAAPQATPTLLARTLPVNRGGAGGFHEGMSWALERDADLVWLMDDDGIPAPDCLDLLLAHHGSFDFWGPAVVAEQDHDRLCFPIRLPGRSTVVHDLADVEAAAVDGLIRDVVIPFNGVLVTRALAEWIGVPREEFFIWGDDVEYLWRAREAGARIATVVEARFYHPATDDLGTPMARGRTTYNHTPSDLKHYCMARNNLVNLLDYGGLAHAAAFVAKTAWFYSFTRPSRARLGLSARAMYAGLRGDFSGHRRFLAPPGPATSAAPSRADQPGTRESVATVVVTYNRADLLSAMLDGLAAQTRQPDAVYVVDNASQDHTGQVLADRTDLPLRVIRSEANLGGAGGFHLGVQRAYADGHDRIWLMDDDVVPAADCLEVLLSHDDGCLAAIREDRTGALVEKAALHFDLRNPLALRPKRASVDSVYDSRAALPERVPLENVAFEGFLVHRRVIDVVGLPDPAFFIFYDDADFAVRARRAGFGVWGIRDAVIVRQLDFDQQHALDTWKGFYMYRNLFVVHFRHGENPLVRLKPYAITAGVVVLSPLRGGLREARNVVAAIRSARGFRRRPDPSSTAALTSRTENTP